MSPGAVASIRERGAEARRQRVGVRAVIFRHHPDGVLVNNLDLRREVCEIIRRHRPNVVVTSDPWRQYQLHPDHRAAGARRAGRRLRRHAGTSSSPSSWWAR